MKPHRPRTARAAYIMRVGIARIGVPIGAIVFVWLLAEGCIAEWVIGAGWVIGAALWHGQDVVRGDGKRKP